MLMGRHVRDLSVYYDLSIWNIDRQPTRRGSFKSFTWHLAQTLNLCHEALRTSVCYPGTGYCGTNRLCPSVYVEANPSCPPCPQWHSFARLQTRNSLLLFPWGNLLLGLAIMPYYRACLLFKVYAHFHNLQPPSILVHFSSLFAVCLAHLIRTWSVMFFLA